MPFSSFWDAFNGFYGLFIELKEITLLSPLVGGRYKKGGDCFQQVVNFKRRIRSGIE